MSGELAWEWGTYKVTDKSGAAAPGEYLSAFKRRAGRWLIIRDIYSSDKSR